MLDKIFLPFQASMPAVIKTLEQAYWKWHSNNNMKCPAFLFVSTQLARKWPYAIVIFAVKHMTAVVFYRPAMAEKPSFYFGDTYEQETIS